MDKTYWVRFIVAAIYNGVIAAVWAVIYLTAPEKLTLGLNMIFFFFITLGSDMLMSFDKVFRTSAMKVSGLTITAMVFLWAVLFVIVKCMI